MAANLKVLPQSIDAEQCVLGGVMMAPHAFDDVADLLHASDFVRREHQTIWRAFCDLEAQGQPQDLLTVESRITEAGDLEAVGGFSYLGSLAANTPSAANIRAYAKIVKDKSIERQLIGAATQIIDRAHEDGETRDKLDHAQSLLMQISDKRDTQEPEFASNLLPGVIDGIEARMKAGGQLLGISTGFMDLDHHTSGLQNQDLVIIAGRPSMGKAQPLDAMVLTTDGWKRMGSLKPGDELASVDGRPSRVAGVFPQGQRQVYRITISDGRSTECCAEHLWKIRHREWETSRVLQTKEIIALLKHARYRNRLFVETFTGEYGHSQQLNVVSIEPTRVTETQCIAVTHPDGLYVTDDYVVTHNTSLAMNIADHHADAGGIPLVFSMEMAKNQLVLRQLATKARIDFQSLRSGQLNDQQWPLLTSAVSQVNRSKILIDDSPALSVLDVRARARRVQRRHGLTLVVVDYLQLMRGAGDSRNEEVAGISRGLKALAKELDVPVIALSQLNRSLESRNNKRPVMSDLRESGAIEQDADLILFLYRDEVYHEDSHDRGIAEVIIGKQRNGPIDTVRLAWLGRYCRFENCVFSHTVRSAPETAWPTV